MKRHKWTQGGMAPDVNGNWMLIPDCLFIYADSACEFLEGLADGAPDAPEFARVAGLVAEDLRKELTRAGYHR